MAAHARRQAQASTSTATSPARAPAPSTTSQAQTGLASGPARSETPMLDALGAEHAADSDTFSERFNEVFQAQLHAFTDDAHAAAEQGPNVNAAHIGRASGEGLSASRLRELFTPVQRDLLAGFMADRRIPDRLFNGDELGGASAQQRIVLSGHILATGEYVPGSFAQRVHARMCGHWANLVMHYAGAGDAGGRGIREQFDHEGNLSLSTGQRSGWTGARMGEEDYLPGEQRPERSQFQMRGMNKDALDGLETGDWLWYYNDNGGGGGNHSVIFSRWASDWESETLPGTDRANWFRRAICMSQRNPADGGAEHTSLLGEYFMRNQAGHRITPVTHYSRVSADARPIRSGDDLRAVLGVGGDAARNQRFIDRLLRRHRGQRIDWEALATEIRGRNTELLRELTGQHRDRMTERQITAIEELNAAALRENSQNSDITTLCRLNDRLQAWIANTGVLEEGEEAQTERVETRHAEQHEATAPERDRIERELEAFDAEIQGYEETQHEAEERLGTLDVAEDLRSARRDRRTWRQRRRDARQRRRGTRDPQERAAIDAELETIATQLESVDEACERLDALRRSNRPEFIAARRTARRQNGLIAQAQRRRGRAEQRLHRLEGQSGRYTTHSANRRAFQGRDETREGRSGLLQNLTPQPNWTGLLVPAEGE